MKSELLRSCSGRLSRGVLVLCAVTGGIAWASPQAPVDVGGTWEGPYFWKAQLGLDLVHCESHEKELSHAALIPKGSQVGKVLMWRQQEGYDAPNNECDDVNTTSVFLIDPGLPDYVIKIDQTLDGSLFCAGQAWQTDGNLLVVGGLPTSVIVPGGSDPREAHRFRPGALGNVQGNPTSGFFISSNPWRQLEDMFRPRYYPTVLTLNNTTMDMPDTNGTIEGGSSIVIGGPAAVDTQGNEFWELNTPGDLRWSDPIAPPVANQVNPPPCLAIPPPNTCVINFEEYSLHGTPGPDQLLDSYPRAWQLTNGQIFIAGDVNTVPGSSNPSTNAHANTPGSAWVIEHPDLLPTDPQDPEWELWSAKMSQDRFYGTAVFFHFVGQKNRAAVFGGSVELSPGVWSVLNTVQEFEPGSNARNEQTSFWRDKSPMIKKRLYPNAVILPTGQALIVGGSESDYGIYHNDAPVEPVFQPELYDLGALPTSSGTRTLMNRSNLTLIDPANPGSGSDRIPRLYHSTALLLPDGRVFVIGGEDDYDTGTPSTTYPEPLFSGEIFLPPYLHFAEFNGGRPMVDDCPSAVNFNATGSTSATFVLDVRASAAVNNIDSVVLLRPAAVTHHFDYDQRFIELKVLYKVYDAYDPARVLITVEAPQEELGPAGFYMLFVTETDNSTARRVPSMASFVRFNPAL